MTTADPAADLTAVAQQQTEQFRANFARLRDEVGRMIVGQGEIIEAALVAFFAGGHVLLEGVPGLGKTMLVRTLAEAVDLKFSRVQFTPDLMPADIIGTTMIVEDETGGKASSSNPARCSPTSCWPTKSTAPRPRRSRRSWRRCRKKHVTVGGVTHRVDEPFMVLATQNPLEMEGTYPLPEAQLDRFFFKLKVEFPTADELHTILDRTTAGATPQVNKALDAAGILEMRRIVRGAPMTREVQAHAIALVLATHPGNAAVAPLAKRFVRYGASPRGVQALILAAKIYALLDGRYHVSRADIDKAAPAALRHRIILNFEGEAEGADSDGIIAEILARK